MKTNKQSGFTLVELMIALAVLSTMLILATTIVISLGNLFTRGVNQSNTQNVARNLVNELSGQLQLGTAVPVIPAGKNVICLGSQRYTFRLDHVNTGAETDHVLWRDTLKNSGASDESCEPVNIVNVADPIDPINGDADQKGTELIPAKMRLTEFSVIDNGNATYTIKVTVAYGGSELVPADDMIHKPGGVTKCRGIQGNQFCAVSSLTQVVTKRGIL